MTVINIESQTAGQGRYTGVRNHGGSLLRGVPILNESVWWDAGLTDGVTLGGTTRLQKIPIHDGTDLRLIYANNYNASELVNPNPITLAAAIEGPVLSGYNQPVIFEATFGGNLSKPLDGSGILISDPIGYDVVTATGIYVRTFVTCTAGNKIPKGFSVDTTRGESVVYSNTAPVNYTTYDANHLGVVMPTTAGTGFGPIAVIGTVSPAAAAGQQPSPIIPIIGLLGDSVMAGYGETAASRPASGWGYGRRALNNAFPFLCVAASGELAAQWGQAATGAGRRLRSSLLDGCTHAVGNHGINDLKAGASLATIQARLVEIWTALSKRGIAVYQATITPFTTSGDGWTSLTQTKALADDTVRTGLNDWIRTIPAPLTGCFEIADLAESARNSGLWKPGYTGDGTHPNSTGHAALAAGVDVSKFTVS